jgi:hypothetical protein
VSGGSDQLWSCQGGSHFAPRESPRDCLVLRAYSGGSGVQLLRGMRALHCAWVVHRDLKLPNLLLSKDGVLKVCDFGLSRFQVRTQLSSVHRGTHAHTAAGRTSWLRFSAKDPLNSAFLDGGRTAPTPVCCPATHPPCSPAASAGLGHEGVVHAGRGEPVVPVARAAAGRHALRHGGAHNSCAPEATAFISLCGNPVSISSVLIQTSGGHVGGGLPAGGAVHAHAALRGHVGAGPAAPHLRHAGQPHARLRAHPPQDAAGTARAARAAYSNEAEAPACGENGKHRSTGGKQAEDAQTSTPGPPLAKGSVWGLGCPHAQPSRGVPPLTSFPPHRPRAWCCRLRAAASRCGSACRAPASTRAMCTATNTKTPR